MKFFFLFHLILLLSLLLFPMTGQSASAYPDCDRSEKALQNFLLTLPSNCSASKDCRTYEAFPGGCKDHFAGNLEAQTFFDSKDFQQLKKEVIKNCQAKWDLMGACAPGWNKKKVRCEDKRCKLEGLL